MLAVPVTAIVLEVAPVELTVILSEGLPIISALKRMYMVVLLTVPPVGDMLTEEP